MLDCRRFGGLAGSEIRHTVNVQFFFRFYMQNAPRRGVAFLRVLYHACYYCINNWYNYSHTVLSSAVRYNLLTHLLRLLLRHLLLMILDNCEL